MGTGQEGTKRLSGAPDRLSFPDLVAAMEMEAAALRDRLARYEEALREVLRGADVMGAWADGRHSDDGDEMAQVLSFADDFASVARAALSEGPTPAGPEPRREQ